VLGSPSGRHCSHAGAPGAAVLTISVRAFVVTASPLYPSLIVDDRQRPPLLRAAVGAPLSWGLAACPVPRPSASAAWDPA